MGLFLNHSNFQNFTRICQGFTSEFKMCSCLACESKKSMDFIFQEQTSKVLIMKGSTEVKANDVRSPCRHFNFSVAPTVDPLDEYNMTCNLKTRVRRPAIIEQDPLREKSMNHTCRTMEFLNNCTRISLHLEMDVKNFTCSMKITWYVLVVVVFIFFLILTLHKILESQRTMWKWQSHKYKPTSDLLRGQDSEKLRTLNVRVISETKQRLPLTQVKKGLPPIPELEVSSTVQPQDRYTRISF